jgi:hypothetical protein
MRITARFLPWLVLSLALLPSVFLAWSGRAMPQLGEFHDDGLYYVGAKSLAEGHGYRIANLPGSPAQTKYPPLYPWLLSLDLRAAPGFAWAALPLAVWVAWLLFGQFGFNSAERAALAAFLALSPTLVFFSVTLMPDLLFTALVGLASLALMQPGRRWVLIAGLAAGAAYLTKTAALPLLALAPVWLALRGERARAAWFLAASLPCAAAWHVWAAAHTSAGGVEAWLYYTNYFGYRLRLFGIGDLPVMVWKNAGALLSGIGGLFIFNLGDTHWGTQLARLVAFGSIAGAVRMARRSGVTPYHWFTAGYIAMLLVWHFPPAERFLIPVMPLLAAGLYTELRHLAGMLRTSIAAGGAHRILAVSLACVLAAMGLWTATSAYGALRYDLPGILAQHRALTALRQGAYQWARENTPSDAAFLAYHDAPLYLSTGRHAMRVTLSPRPFYTGASDAYKEPFRHLDDTMRALGLDYLIVTPADFHSDLPPAEQAALRELMLGGGAFERVYESRGVAIYRLGRTR